MSDEIKITPGQGLFSQIQKTNVHPYSKLKLEGILEIVDEWALKEWRDRLRLQLFRLDVFTDEERNIIYNMINSDDQENIYMAEQILKFKEDEKGS